MSKVPLLMLFILTASILTGTQLENRFQNYMNKPEGKRLMVITTGLNIGYLNASRKIQGIKETFTHSNFGYNVGISLIRKLKTYSKPVELETGLFLTRDFSKSRDFESLKSTGAINYLRVPIMIRALHQLKSGNHLTFAIGPFIRKGISQEYHKYDWGIQHAIGYRKKRIETDFSVRMVLIDTIYLGHSLGNAFAGDQTYNDGAPNIVSYVFNVDVRFRL